MISQNQSDQTNQVVIVLNGHIDVTDKASDDYAYLPFSAPPNLSRLEVEYDYTRTSMTRSRAGEENILDLGVFCPGSGATNPGDFRGWSGGARSGFFITRENATPGYLAGPMPQGTWHIILGLYRIATTGCDYTVTVTLVTETNSHETASPPDAEAAFEKNVAGRRDSAEPGAKPKTLRWYVGDLQSHTFHSDAKASPTEIARVARDRRLDFLAVTDHNTTSHHAELGDLSTKDLLLIPGMEITTYYGHANAWGLSQWVDFRCRTHSDFAESMEAVHSQRALVSVNHPYSDCPWTFGWMDGIDAIEVWQGLWNEGNANAVKWWDELLRSGLRITGVGGSDRHQPAHYDPYFPHQVGTPATRVLADHLSSEAILDGIQSGRVTISASPTGPWIDLDVIGKDGFSAGIGEEIAVREGTEILVQCTVHEASEHTLELISDGILIERRPLEPGENEVELSVITQRNVYIRAQVASQVTDSETESKRPRICALSNPVYLVDEYHRKGAPVVSAE